MDIWWKGIFNKLGIGKKQVEGKSLEEAHKEFLSPKKEIEESKEEPK